MKVSREDTEGMDEYHWYTCPTNKPLGSWERVYETPRLYSESSQHDGVFQDEIGNLYQMCSANPSSRLENRNNLNTPQITKRAWNINYTSVCDLRWDRVIEPKMTHDNKFIARIYFHGDYCILRYAIIWRFDGWDALLEMNGEGVFIGRCEYKSGAIKICEDHYYKTIIGNLKKYKDLPENSNRLGVQEIAEIIRIAMDEYAEDNDPSKPVINLNSVAEAILKNIRVHEKK